jgi:hypothetical protein
MTELDQLRGWCRPEPASAALPIGTVVIDDPSTVDRALDGLVDYFGADRKGRREVRVVVQGEELGYLGREALYEHVALIDRGLGTSGYAALPGFTVGASVLQLVCTVDGCTEGPVLAMSYDEDHAPRCRVHETPLTPA